MLTDTDPTYFPTTTIDASPAVLPREGEAVGEQPDLAKKIDGLEFMLHRQRLDIGNLTIGKANAENDWRNESMKVRGLGNQVADLKDELAKRDETIADMGATESNLASVIDKKNEDIEELKNCITVHKETATHQSRLITSLRSQLARAGAIEEAAELAQWRLGQMRPSDKRSFCLDGVEDKLMSALAKPSPGPHATPKGERIAILERVAKHAKEYDTSEFTADHFQHYHLLRIALADLARLEATQ